MKPKSFGTPVIFARKQAELDKLSEKLEGHVYSLNLKIRLSGVHLLPMGNESAFNIPPQLASENWSNQI
jgi:hypothetical protein